MSTDTVRASHLLIKHSGSRRSVPHQTLDESLCGLSKLSARVDTSMSEKTLVNASILYNSSRTAA
jgi:hypothetical protein